MVVKRGAIEVDDKAIKSELSSFCPKWGSSITSLDMHISSSVLLTRRPLFSSLTPADRIIIPRSPSTIYNGLGRKGGEMGQLLLVFGIVNLLKGVAPSPLSSRGAHKAVERGWIGLYLSTAERTINQK